MTYSMDYFEHEGGLIVTWTGKVKGNEVIRSYEERFSPMERLVKLRYIISDYSSASDFEVTPDQIKAIAQIANRAALNNRTLFGVAVMPSDIEYGMARMFQAYADDDTTGWHTFVTRSRKEGEEWLRNYLDVNLTFAHP